MPKGIYKHHSNQGFQKKNKVWVGRKHTQKTKEKTKKEKSCKWKGDNVGYQGIHLWLRTNFGKPSFCEHCGDTKAKKYDWANINNHTYRRKKEDFIRLCRKCHIKLDKNK